MINKSIEDKKAQGNFIEFSTTFYNADNKNTSKPDSSNNIISNNPQNPVGTNNAKQTNELTGVELQKEKQGEEEQKEERIVEMMTMNDAPQQMRRQSNDYRLAFKQELSMFVYCIFMLLIRVAKMASKLSSFPFDHIIILTSLSSIIECLYKIFLSYAFLSNRFAKELYIFIFFIFIILDQCLIIYTYDNNNIYYVKYIDFLSTEFSVFPLLFECKTKFDKLYGEGQL